jgi:predicted transglutaminase-like cysteine proteinase
MGLGSAKGWRGVVLGAVALIGLGLSPGQAAAKNWMLASTHPATLPIFGREAPPTVGAALWCSKDRSEPFCRGVHAYRPLHLSDATAELLGKVNKAVNVAIEPVPDMVQWGVPEKWNRPVRGADGRLQDDCDGYVIEKWYRLVRQDHLPADSFYPLYAEVPGYGGHLVLAVDTDKGTYILNNLTDSIVPLQKFSFTYLKRPMPGEPLDGPWQRFVAFSDHPARPAIVADRGLGLNSAGVSSAGVRLGGNGRTQTGTDR